MGTAGARRAPSVPGPKPPRAAGRRRYFHGGATSMVILSGVLAVVVALVATIVYAQVDAGRKLTGDPNGPPRPSPATTTAADDGPTTTRLEILSPDELSTKLQASVRAVHTFDDAGQPVEGTAFVVGTAGGQTLLLTSFAVVKAAVREPAPPIVLGDSTPATLWTWQEDRDLALLTIGGSVESLPWASAPAKKGDKIFSAAAGQKLSTGVVTAVSDSAIEHNIFTDLPRQGAPIVNQRGEVVGMASLVYDPTGKATDTVFIGVPIRASCERIIRCASGNTVVSDTTTTAAGGTATTKP